MRKVFTSLVAFATVFLLFTPNAFAGQKVRDQVVDIAHQYSGSPYVYGGTSPSGFDCSGFTQYVFAKAGIDLNRTSRSQYQQGEYVSRSDLKPGDLVFFGSPIWHVGIYIGNNKMISAENSRDDIEVASLSGYWGRNYTGAKRVIDDEPVKVAEKQPETLDQYNDVRVGYWAADHIEHMSNEGIIEGYNGSFMPTNNITRGSVAKMLSTALGISPSNDQQFSDVPSSHWASGYINALAKKGYITGYTDGKFAPNDDITREEIAALFNKVFDLGGSTSDFSDVNSNHWAYDEIQSLAASGVTHGYTDNTFRPTNEASRSEFTVFLYRATN
ncbi:S-layer homology domain-containing protein [Halobacillus dabanensis]|uniref:S-layer homology domain-containing protein n=1 Tax=Halobacillus dabanensis TaxID=240302 RepID=A0A1I3XFU2_HALDA|nr:C40 family peptidase [Halobacillus dabanensis]SFK18199.1 S-layer homology domain-containing protein [Halobacillus dabanensis]